MTVWAGGRGPVFQTFIDCEPAPKGSVDVNAAGRGVRHTQRSKEFETDVADKLLRILPGGSPFEPGLAVLVTAEFRQRRPRGVLEPFPTRLNDGDEDKLQRGLRDGLVKGRLIEDDRLIVGGRTLQRWADEWERTGVQIRVEYAPPGYRLAQFPIAQNPFSSSVSNGAT